MQNEEPLINPWLNGFCGFHYNLGPSPYPLPPQSPSNAVHSIGPSGLYQISYDFHHGPANTSGFLAGPAIFHGADWRSK